MTKFTDQYKDSRWQKGNDTGIGVPLPAIPGLYALYLQNEIVYIGQSDNIQKRFWQHRKHLKMLFNDLGKDYYIFYGYVTKASYSPRMYWKFSFDPALESRLFREKRLIKKCQPVCNRMHKAVKNG
jgi:hypothetical protein